MQNGEYAFEEFLEDAQKEYVQTHQDLKEIDILIKQSAAEVERLTQRNAQAVNYITQLGTNFDTVPREDIREGYEALSRTQQKLFTMRGQLEKLQSDQRNIERFSDFQQRLLELGTGSTPLPTEASPRKMNDQFSIIRVIQTEETARKGLVRKMHDGPASSLSNFILQAEICQRFFDTDAERTRAELNALKSSAAATFNQVKNFIFDLRPMMLDDLGVVPTLRRYVESFQEKSGIPVPITVTGVERRLESHVEVTIFRGVQELLNNGMNHSQATQIQVMVDLAHERILAVVEDNGTGFDSDAALRHPSVGIGLTTLRERIELLGGKLSIQSQLGQGTRAEFFVPVTAQD